MLWPIALMALGGLLVGGAWAMRKQSPLLAVALAICAALAVASAILRMGVQ